MGENKLQVIVTNEALLKEVTFNYDQLKTSLGRKLKKYKDMEVSEENIKDAKEDRAELNSIEKVLATKSSEIRAKILNGFDTKMTELRSMVKETSQQIDVQVKALEQIKKDEKQKQIEQIYVENIGGLKEVLPFGKIFNLRWLNTTGQSLEKITGEIIAIIEKARNDLMAIDSLQSDFALQIKDTYLQTLDLTAALNEKARLEDQKKKIENIENIQPRFVSIDKTNVRPTEEMPAWANVSDKPKEITLIISGSEKQFNFVKTFLNTQKIKWRAKYRIGSCGIMRHVSMSQRVKWKR